MRSLKAQIDWHQRYQILLGAMLLVVLVFWYFGGYRPQMDREALILAERAHLRLQLEEGQSKAMAIPDVAKKLEKLKSTLADYKALPENSELGEFMGKITQLSEQTQVHKVQLNFPAGPRRSDEFTELPVSLKFEGDFLSIFNFLRAVENLPRLTRISDISVRGGDLRSGIVQVEMSMSIYYGEGS